MLSEAVCEGCGPSPRTSVKFRYWTFTVTSTDGTSLTVEPTPGMNRDVEEAAAQVIVSQGGTVSYYCPDFPRCAERASEPAE